MEGLKIKTVTGAEFTVYGHVTWQDDEKDGKVYYCDGRSWPEEIVMEVLR